MAALYSQKLRGWLGRLAFASVVIGAAPPLAAQTPARSETGQTAPPDSSSESPPPGASPAEPSPRAPTRAHDPSVTGGAGTPPPGPPITVRPGIEPSSEGGREREFVERPPELLPSWSERRVAVVLVPGHPGVSLRIRPLGLPSDEEVCGTDGCIASVRPGHYEISVIDRGSDTGSRELDLTRSERLVLTPPDESARTTGLVLGVAGSVLFGAGVVMSVAAYSSSLSECGDGGDCDHTPPWLGPLGITAGITGGVAMPIGWVLFGNNLAPRVERTPVDPATLRAVARSARLNAWVDREHDRVELSGSFSF